MNNLGSLFISVFALCAIALPQAAQARGNDHFRPRQSEGLVRCSMDICVDPWNRYSNDIFMCEHSNQWVATPISAIGDSEREVYKDLSHRGVHWDSTLTCDRL